MKTVYLARHAKSEKGFEGIDDFDRPLNQRGIHNANLIGSVLKERGEIPGLFITSPAIRALSTAFIFARKMNFSWDHILIHESIYEAAFTDLLNVIKSVPDEYSSVMLFGHNPSFTDAVNKLSGAGIGNVPTSAVACIDFEAGTWEEIAPGGGKLRSFDTPKDHV